MAEDMDLKVAIKNVENRKEKLNTISGVIVKVTAEEKIWTGTLRSAEEKLATLSASKNLAVGDLEKAKKRRDELLNLSPEIGSGGEEPDSGGGGGGGGDCGAVADADKEVQARTDDVARIETEIGEAMAEKAEAEKNLLVLKQRLSILSRRKFMAAAEVGKAVEEYDDAVSAKAKNMVAVVEAPSAGSIFAGGGHQPDGDGQSQSSSEETETSASSVDSGACTEADGFTNLDNKVADHECLGCESVGSNSPSLDGDGHEDAEGDDGADQP